jgi:NAD(P)-dependent dehydrogenase (short-subunit alcohol dehydrogenase family)
MVRSGAIAYLGNMSRTIVVVGYGPGNATAVADKFGREGFSVALIGRNAERLGGGVAALDARGIPAFAVPADAGNPESIRAAIRTVRAELNSITVLFWNAYGGTEAGDLLAASPEALRGIFDVAVFGLLAATNEALPDLKKNEGAILVTNGAFGDVSEETDKFVTSINATGIALGNAAKNKLVGLLAQRLKPDGVYVGEVMIQGTIKGTATGNGSSIDPSVVADKFWDIYRARGEIRARVS